MDHQLTSVPGSQTLVSLDSASDCYESFLLNLLRVYTQNRMDGSSLSEVDTKTNSLFTIDSISPESIDALSQEQVQSLVTSNSTNYDVIHQILAYRQRGGGLVRSSSTLENNGVGGQGNDGAAAHIGGEKSSDEAMSALQQLQALQLTPEQLKQIQLQMAELIRTKQIVLPTELSVEQQQQLLQSLILKQVHMQHQQDLKPTTLPPASSNPPPTADTSSTSVTKTTAGGGTLAAMLSNDVGNQETVKMEVPAPSNISSPGSNTDTVPLQLSSNPVVSVFYISRCLY